MPNGLTGGAGTVAIHRWFADGEGWAYHPWFAPRTHELLRLLKTELDSRRQLASTGGRRTFLYPALGGVLLGEQVHDGSCPDPSAIARYPTILRVVYLLAPPSEGERGRMLRGLTAVDCQKAGEDSSLTIELPEPEAGLPSPRGHTRWAPYRILGLMLIVLLAVASLGLIAWSQSWLAQIKQQPGPSQKELELARSRMEEHLARWEGKRVNEEQPIVVGQRFLDFLSQKSVAGNLVGTHPDVEFIKRLPERAGTPTSVEELEEELNRLLARLSSEGKHSVTDRTQALRKSLPELVSAIADEMDYLRWWGRGGKRLPYALTAKRATPPADFACKFLSERPGFRTNLSWQDPVARAMIKDLEAWGVEAVDVDDASRRPWLVFHCYFQFLSQQHFTSEEMSDLTSYQTEFVRRLPDKTLSEDGAFGDEGQLLKELGALAEHLRAEQSQLAPTLISNIAAELNYPQWRDTVKIHRSNEAGADAVKRYVERFKRTR